MIANKSNTNNIQKFINQFLNKLYELDKIAKLLINDSNDTP